MSVLNLMSSTQDLLKRSLQLGSILPCFEEISGRVPGAVRQSARRESTQEHPFVLDTDDIWEELRSFLDKSYRCPVRADGRFGDARRALVEQLGVRALVDPPAFLRRRFGGGAL